MLRYSTACSVACLLALCAPAPAAVTLASGDKSTYRIVLPAEAIPSEVYAADELQRYLEKISGARIAVVRDSEKPGSADILLANNSHLKEAGLDISTGELGTDGYTLRTAGKHLVIVGGRPRGTLNGVYSFLEEKLGVRWFTSEVEVVPRTNRIILPELNETKLPELENREVFWTEMMKDGDFAARHRLNGNHLKLTEKHGGRFAVYYPFVHSFDMLVPPNLFTNHPDYFPLIKGKRTGGYVQRCLSNPEVVNMSIANVRRWIQAHPEASIISVSQNDTFNYCECPECKAIDGAEGTPMGSMLRFVNTIAEDIEKDYPKVRIDTLAYQYTRKPPKNLRPRRNVIIRLCSIECCFAHPLETCNSEENKRFRGDIVAWEPVAPLLYVWDYTPNFGHYQQPFPNFDAIQPNVQFFVQHKVKGLFEQGNYSSGGAGEMGPLRAYLLAKLLWNPTTELRRHTDEFCAAYYGKAAPKIQEFIDLMQQQVRGKDIHAHIFDSPRAAYLNADFVKAANAILDDAEALADSAGAEWKGRVQTARLPVWYLQLVNKGVTGEERKELLDTFMRVARAAKVSHISEGQALDAWEAKMKAAP